MSTKKRSVPVPKSDPRGYESMQGSPMNVKEHPANTVPTATEHYDGDQAYKDATSGFGQKTLYSLETGQMNSAVGVQDKVRSRFDDESN